MNPQDIDNYVQRAYTFQGWVWAAIWTFIIITIWRRLPRRVMFWKVSLTFPNDALWFVSIFVSAVITMILAPPAVQSYNAHQWRLINIMLGGAIGFIVRLLYVVIIGKIEARFPAVKDALDGEDNFGDVQASASLQTPQPKPAEKTGTTV